MTPPEQSPQKSVFRQASLDRLASPEQLDELMQVTSLKSWIALAGLSLIVVFVLLWSCFGIIKETVSGQGIIVRSSGIQNIYSQANGQITETLVSEGDWVNSGQVVARISQPELAAQIEQTERSLIEINKLIAEAGANKAKEAATIEMQIKSMEIERNLQQLRVRKDVLSQVISPFEGRVIEQKFRAGALATVGAPLFGVELKGVKKEVVVCITASQSKKVIVGMKAQISPSTVRREEYGYILGRVRSVSKYPVSAQGLSSWIAIDDLSRTFGKDEPVFAVFVDMVEDALVPSGFRWSSGKGPPTEVHSGTFCTVNIEVRSQHPISYVLPWLKSLAGI